MSANLIPSPVGTDDRAAWSRLCALVLNSVASPSSKRNYAIALNSYYTWATTSRQSQFSKASVTAYKSHLDALGQSPSWINVQLAAIRKLAAEMADNGMLAPAVATAISRVKGARKLGTSVGMWLTREQTEAFIDAPDKESAKGKRDRAIFCVLFGCGLRRDECARLLPSHIQQRDGRWVIVDLVGKGGRVRSVPMPAWAKVAIDAWQVEVDKQEARKQDEKDKAGTESGQVGGGEEIAQSAVAECASEEEAQESSISTRRGGIKSGDIGQPDTGEGANGLGYGAAIPPAAPARLFRAISRSSRILSLSLSGQAIGDLIAAYCVKLGADMPRIRPHDTRRTHAKLARKGGADMAQIQQALGHASITTTERYLGVTQDLADAPCDHLGIKLQR